MVSYYNYPLAMYPKNHSGGPNLPYASSPSAAWYAQNYHHQQNAAQFLGDSDGPPQAVHYPPHMFHQSSPDWTGHDAYGGPPLNTGTSGNGLGGPAGYLSINQATQNGNNLNEHINDGLQSLPSPPITVSGSDMSSPGAPNGTSSPRINSRPTPVKSPYEWINKPSYQSQPNPGKTRTKDKYRVVYTDHQRLELEKEFHYTRYITIRRKSELAQTLSLSERQVKIWFQNRRAKDRKQNKKLKMSSGDSNSVNGQPGLTQSHNNINTSSISSSNISGFLDVKPKIDPSLHLQHFHHQISSMGFGYDHKMNIHAHHALNSHHLAQQLPPTSHSQQSNSQPSSSPSMMLG